MPYDKWVGGVFEQDYNEYNEKETESSQIIMGGEAARDLMVLSHYDKNLYLRSYQLG